MKIMSIVLEYLFSEWVSDSMIDIYRFLFFYLLLFTIKTSIPNISLE